MNDSGEDYMIHFHTSNNCLNEYTAYPLVEWCCVFYYINFFYTQPTQQSLPHVHTCQDHCHIQPYKLAENLGALDCQVLFCYLWTYSLYYSLRESSIDLPPIWWICWCWLFNRDFVPKI
jgi:hypothetical protein